MVDCINDKNTERHRCKIFQLSNEHNLCWQDYLKWYQEAGFNVQILSYQRWANKLLEIKQGNALIPLIPYYSAEASEANLRQNNITDYSNQNLLKQLKLFDYSLPQPKPAFKKAHLSFLVNSGFLDGIKNDNQSINL